MITRKIAREHQAKRSPRAKMKDAQQDNSIIVNDERFLRDSAHCDFKGVDTFGRGSHANLGRKSGRDQRHKKKKKSSGKKKSS